MAIISVYMKNSIIEKGIRKNIDRHSLTNISRESLLPYQGYPEPLLLVTLFLETSQSPSLFMRGLQATCSKRGHVIHGGQRDVDPPWPFDSI